MLRVVEVEDEAADEIVEALVVSAVAAAMIAVLMVVLCQSLRYDVDTGLYNNSLPPCNVDDLLEY